MKDAVATMGTILPEDAGGRDAVHVAVFSAVSDERLKPGQHVGVVHQDGTDIQVSTRRIPIEGTIAIVDPFLEKTVEPGQRFWAYLYPRTITALSHRWSHPALEETASIYVPPATKLASEQWLQDFCLKNDAPQYDDLIRAVTAMADGKTRESWGDEGEWADYYGWWTDGEFFGFGGQDAHCAIPPELWHHVEIVIGKPIPGVKPNYFTCSC
jgi:hypothetical protein